MDLSKVKSKVENAGIKAVKKSKEAKEIFSIKTEISTCEDLIKRSYAAIGRMYYEMYSESNPNPEFEKSMKEIANAKKAIAALEAKLEDIKNS